jgi:hypothetical protein
MKFARGGFPAIKTGMTQLPVLLWSGFGGMQETA